MRTVLAVTGVGIVSPVGLTAIETFFSIRSGITRLRTQELPDSTRQWITGGNISDWVPEITTERLRRLAEASIRQAWEMARRNSDSASLGPSALFIGIPEAGRPGYYFPQGSVELKRWLGTIGIASIVHAESIAAGSCNAQFGLIKAAEFLASGVARSCIIGAVDCLLQVKILRWLEMAYRLKCSYMTDGLIPGESACFLVVESLSGAQARRAQILARLQSVSVSREEATIGSDAPNTAMGLTDAVERAIKAAEIPPGHIGSIWSDLNGESYRAREWAFVEIRQGFPSSIDLRHPADCYGDIGSATDAGLIGLATLEQASGWSRGKPSLVFSGSENGFRSATVIAPSKTEVNGSIIQVSVELPQVYPIDLHVPPLGPDDEDYENSPNPPRSYFEWQLRQEHLDDLISLYYQRKTLLKDPEISWERVKEVEQRMLNHFDAVVASGVSSVWAIASGIMLKDEGAAFIATLLLGSLHGSTGIDIIRDVVSGTEKVNLRGLSEALKHAPHQDVKRLLGEWMQDRRREDLRVIGVELAGYRRECDGPRLAEILQEGLDEVQTYAATALRRCGYSQALPFIENFMNRASPISQAELLLSALSLGSYAGVNRCRKLIFQDNNSDSAVIELLGRCGSRSDVNSLIRSRSGGFDDESMIRTAGVLGGVEAVPYLFKTLLHENESLRIAAAQALELITGADLRETVLVKSGNSDTVEDELVRSNGEIERSTTNHQAWSNWWQHNGTRFRDEVRWRKGVPFTLGMLISTMLDKKALYHDRYQAYLELVIRSGHDIPFEPDWFVAKQTKSLSLWQSWWKANQARFAPGKWYFHGEQI